jgi:putative membrane-bound dehydrogenase-like protein
MRKIVYPIILSLIILSFCQQKKQTKGSLSPHEALRTFEIAEGFKIELVAAEPLVADPVAMEVDESGNIYVVEMHGYPLDKSGTGKIKRLTDTNKDGLPDKSAVFADKLVLPSGIMRWKKGFLVTDVPDVLYLEDSDGDGVADIRTIILTGFAVSNPQHNANTPLLGLDNWIYISHEGEVTPKVFVQEFGDTGSLIRFPNRAKSPSLPRNANGRNIRFKPDNYELEMLSGDGQYGQTFDPWGHQILTMNYKHLFHEVIAARYLENNPNLLVDLALQNLPDHGNAAEVYPITKNPIHQLLTDVGVITSSCGVTWYQGGLFPDSFNAVTFVAEPVHNLVHADRISDQGASFVASRVYNHKEFLASTDPWFRPVQFYIGPDGALYIIDYYRQIVEHPEWMSDEVVKSGALYNGSDKGRIYRITPDGSPKLSWCSQMKNDQLSIQELVRQLSSKNIWWRRNAQRLLIDRRDDKSAKYLQQLIDTCSYPQAIAHALWTLEGIGRIDAQTIRKNLRHAVAGVRENAIRISELHRKDMPELDSVLLSLQNDGDSKVRYQLLCTLGFINGERSQNAKENILFKDIEDRWVQVAALSSSFGKELELLEKGIQSLSSIETEGRSLFFNNCATVVGLSQNAADIRKLVQLVTKKSTSSSAWWQEASLAGLEKGLSAKGKPPGDFRELRLALLSLFNPESPANVRHAAVNLFKVFYLSNSQELNLVRDKAKRIVLDKQAKSEYREDALLLLSLYNYDAELEKIFLQLIDPAEPERLQSTAIASYIRQSGERGCKEILQSWNTLTPAVRNSAIDYFLSSPDNINILLDAVQQGKVQTASIGWSRTVDLMYNNDSAIRMRARQLLHRGTSNREDVFKKYQASTSEVGNAINGAVVFQRNCSICHQIEGSYGKPFGPDLASIRNRDIQFILADILDPNRSIADGFELWTVHNKQNKIISGIISAETSNSITLRDAAGNEITMPRSEIQKIEAGTISAMPTGIEATISVQEMSDLLAYLKKPL